MILMDNKFSSIPVAIELGRLVFDNLKKVAIYLMPVGCTRIRATVERTNSCRRLVHTLSS